MPVHIKKKSLTLMSVVKQLFTAEQTQGGIGHDAFALENAGAILVTTPSKLLIQIDDGHNMVTLAGTQIKLDTLELTLKGQVGGAAKASLKAKLETVYSLASKELMNIQFKNPPIIGNTKEKIYFQADHPEVFAQTMAKYEEAGGKVAAIKLFRKLTGYDLKTSKDQVEAWISWEGQNKPTVGAVLVKKDEAVTFTIKGLDETKKPWKMKDGSDPDAEVTLVRAKEAKYIHQPVKGTSSDSVYHVIGIGPELVVAARIRKDFDTAIRVELKNPDSNEGQLLKHRLSTAGFATKHQGHFSLHLEPDSEAMAQKCVGAMLFSLGKDVQEVSLRVDQIIGAGK